MSKPDIVKRLWLSVTKGHEPTDEGAIEAAAEIEQLRDWRKQAQTEIERLCAKIEQLRTSELAWKLMYQQDFKESELPQSKNEPALSKALSDVTAESENRLANIEQ